MLVKIQATLMWFSLLAFSIAAHFGFRCPAPGCPCCKIVGE